jgi:hypothetical protein
MKWNCLCGWSGNTLKTVAQPCGEIVHVCPSCHEREGLRAAPRCDACDSVLTRVRNQPGLRCTNIECPESDWRPGTPADMPYQRDYDEDLEEAWTRG